MADFSFFLPFSPSYLPFQYVLIYLINLMTYILELAECNTWGWLKDWGLIKDFSGSFPLTGEGFA